jgi:hypothetical protein
MGRGLRIGFATQYTTNFDATENPLGSPWISPQAAGFTVCRSSGGRAYGTNGVTDTYDDSYAYLSGYNANHECEATIYRQGSALPGVNHEVELHVRMSDSSSTNIVKSYEVLVNKDGNYQLMKWAGTYAGPPDFFYELASGNLSGTPANGDKMRVRAETSGANCVITFWYTPVSTGIESQIAQATDTGAVGGAVHTSGQPGMAFFNRPGATNDGFCGRRSSDSARSWGPT